MRGESYNDQVIALVDLLQLEVPTINARVERRGILLDTGKKTIQLQESEIGRFPARERVERRRERLNYVDLGTGEVFVDEAGIFLLLRLGKPTSKLTPQQCAVLAAALETDGFDWLVEALSLEPGLFRESLARRIGIQLTPSAVTKLRKALVSPRIAQRGRPTRQRAFDAILSDFRLDAIGKAIRIPAPARGQVEWVRNTTGGARVLEGVSSVLAERTGAIIEPLDVLLTRSAAVQLEQAVGGAVGPDFRGPTILVRGVKRLSLDELAPSGGRQLQAILAIADAAASREPVRRESATHLVETMRSQWT